MAISKTPTKSAPVCSLRFAQAVAVPDLTSSRALTAIPLRAPSPFPRVPTRRVRSYVASRKPSVKISLGKKRRVVRRCPHRARRALLRRGLVAPREQRGQAAEPDAVAHGAVGGENQPDPLEIFRAMLDLTLNLTHVMWVYGPGGPGFRR